MGVFSMFWFIFFILESIVFQVSQSATLVVDGVSEWKNSTVQIGDTIIFQHKYQYNLYIFQNQNAFTLCNFTEATLLTKSNSKSKSYTWHPSRPGFFYFSFNNGTNTSCLHGQKLAIKVKEQFLSPEISQVAAAPLISGYVSSSPAYTWPLPPRETISPANSPMVGYDIPFIKSNPAVPLPTGEVDSATVHHFPTSSHHDIQVLSFVTIQSFLCCAIFLMLL